jgi:hypothetical protein
MNRTGHHLTAKKFWWPKTSPKMTFKNPAKSLIFSRRITLAGIHIAVAGDNRGAFRAQPRQAIHAGRRLHKGKCLDGFDGSANDRLSRQTGRRALSTPARTLQNDSRRTLREPGGLGLLGEGGEGKPILIPHAQGRPAPPGEPLRPSVGTVGPEYFETVGMTILRGRGFAARDFDRASSQAVIVNEAFARYYFGEADPIGQRFGYNEAGDQIEKLPMPLRTFPINGLRGRVTIASMLISIRYSTWS